MVPYSCRLKKKEVASTRFWKEFMFYLCCVISISFISYLFIMSSLLFSLSSLLCHHCLCLCLCCSLQLCPSVEDVQVYNCTSQQWLTGGKHTHITHIDLQETKTTAQMSTTQLLLLLFGLLDYCYCYINSNCSINCFIN